MFQLLQCSSCCTLLPPLFSLPSLSCVSGTSETPHIPHLTPVLSLVRVSRHPVHQRLTPVILPLAHVGLTGNVIRLEVVTHQTEHLRESRLEKTVNWFLVSFRLDILHSGYCSGEIHHRLLSIFKSIFELFQVGLKKSNFE